MGHAQVISAALLILLLPLAAFLVQVLLPVAWRGRERQGDWIPTGAMGFAMLCALGIFYTQVIARPGGIREPIHQQISFGPTQTKADLKEGVERTFRALDTNHDGYLDASDLGGPVLKEADADGDGRLSKAELLAWRSAPERANAWVTIGELLPVDRANSTAGFRGAHAATLRLDFGILIDNLTAIMLVVVTVVSFLVHLYSTGYMRDHHGHPAPRYGRFFAFLGLFTFSMLGLVLTDNLFMLFVFWELVGVCSYFLIGFEFERAAAQVAQIKAFMTTRVGDVFFFIGIMIIGATVGSFRFDDIFASIPQNTWIPWLLTASAILLFIGPVGKSAQFPLHVWLPDAMEGPTPVSALIHAATMVAAGVYLVARMFPFFAGPSFFREAANYFESTPLAVVAFTGGFTAIFAATIALCQNDIKKVLAYSTISQLGYMVLGIGVGSFAAGMFHLWTHAFFKALLFLGSGSVIHAVGTNDMREMGGLRRKMPITFWTFLVATAAISGVPWLSGFYSKEAILTQALSFGLYRAEGSPTGVLFLLPFAMGMVTAGLTAFYMFRIIFMTFLGEPRNEHRFDHAHESPWNMTVPLGVLCLFTLFSAGVMGFKSDWFSNRVNNQTPLRIVAERYPELVKPVLKEEPTEMVAEHEGEAAVEAEPYIVFPAKLDEESRGRAEIVPKLLSLLAATCGISFCWAVFLGPLRFEDLSPRGTWLGSYRRVLEKLYFMDDLYDWAFVQPLLRLRLKLKDFDRGVIDRVVDFAGESVVWTCGLMERLDRRSLGMARGARLAAVATVVSALALARSAGSEIQNVGIELGPLGVIWVKLGVVRGLELALLISVGSIFVLARGGVSKAGAVAIGFVLALAGLFGAETGVYVSKWMSGDVSHRLYMDYLSHHPLRAAATALIGCFALIAWWAGLGVDGSVRWVAETAVLACGRVVRAAQTGRLQEYLFATIVGIVAIICLVAIV
jgi:NADH-quinone oxidoreductase subunit L